MRSGGDEHLYNPATIHMLQESTRRGDYQMFKQYTAMVNDEDFHQESQRTDGLQLSEKGCAY